jgi:NAD-dependent DNA ligase
MNEEYYETTARNRHGTPVAMYLMAAYAYYVDDEPIMSDYEFDMLARTILKEYDKYSKHPHCPTQDDLRAGTYLGKYPTIVRVALDTYKRSLRGL